MHMMRFHGILRKALKLSLIGRVCLSCPKRMGTGPLGLVPILLGTLKHLMAFFSSPFAAFDGSFPVRADAAFGYRDQTLAPPRITAPLFSRLLPTDKLGRDGKAGNRFFPDESHPEDPLSPRGGCLVREE